MAHIKAFMIVPSLFFTASLLCMDQGLTLGQQKVARIKEKQESYLEKCAIIGTHKGGKPLLKALEKACLINAVFDLQTGLMYRESALQMAGGAGLNAFAAYVIHKSGGLLTEKKEVAEKDITTLLNDLDALLAQDAMIKPQQLAVGSLRTQVSEHRAISNAYLGGALICLGNVAKNFIIAYSLSDAVKANPSLGMTLTAERLTYYLFGILALQYSHAAVQKKEEINKIEKSESAKLTTLVDNLAKPKEGNNNE